MKQQLQIIMASCLIMVLLAFCSLWSGTTGKITGRVTDKATGESMIGANVLIKGSNMGTAADMNGYYTILYVPPGIYEVEVTVIGYTKVTVTDVRVRIDQTTRVNVELKMEALEGETVTIVADRDIIKEDVATSVVAVTGREVEELPVSDIESVVGLQAGIQNDLEIRGGQSDEALVLMDGVTLRDPRNNNPISTIALSAVKEISIERGGFNAEYGQVRSGIVNVVTKEGSKSSYHGNMELKYSPPAAKHFGISPFDRNSFWLRPYFDEDVCWTGTASGSWDEYRQRQYPDFEGWNSISEKLMTDSDPSNNLTPKAAQRLFMWETRKQPPSDQPDYNIDAGLGGPVPLIGPLLGNLRFYTSYRKKREMLIVPLTREDYVDYDWSLKLTSDISPSMKLMMTALTGKRFTMQQNWSYDYLTDSGTITDLIEDRPGRLFGTGAFSLSDISHRNLAAKLTHMLNQNTFYEVSLEHFQRKYYTRPTTRRDTTRKYEIVPGYFVDEAPFNYNPMNEAGITGMLSGGHTSKRRDNTVASSTTLKGDLTSQININNMLKAGIEIVYNDLDFDYGNIQSLTDGTVYDEHVQFRVFPVRASIYVQDKLEAKGFIMNAGLRLDYSNSRSEWWDVNPYDKLFFSSKYNDDLEFEMRQSESQWQLSPRLGISHPITENSKLFFNYGHFKQMPSYETLFRIGRSSSRSVTILGDPNLILAKTISYELGYDHSLFNTFLFQLAAFYHDILDQQDETTYSSIGGIVYDRTTSNSYEDIRGFELTLRKNQGRWWTFFANYTYQVSTSGHFGREEIYEDPSIQKTYDEETTNLYQERPIPRPYARFNLSLFTPQDFGPSFMKIYPLGGYMANLLLDWQAGEWVTWSPKDQTLENNVEETDHFNAILRISKTFNFKKFRIQAFMDIDNLFNYRRMSLRNFRGKGGDRDYYYASLHLPESDAYDNIPGDDKVGTYRKEGVAYQPIFPRGNLDLPGDPDVIYYDKSSKRYVEYVDDTWIDADKDKLDQVLEDKAYIDMPNQDSFTFFDPRQIFFGLRVSFNLN